jgi:prolyl oligopeptidase
MTSPYKHQLLLITILLWFYPLKSQSSLEKLPPQVIKDTFYGKIVEDPYRFLENTEDSLVKKWLKEQSIRTSNIIRNLPGWETILVKQQNSKRKGPAYRLLKTTENNLYFYLKQESIDKPYKLYFRKSFNGEEIFLFDLKDLKKKSEYEINYLQPSPDGSKIAIGFTQNSEEISEMIVLDVKNRKLFSQIITHCWPAQLGGVSWLKDNSGFYYQHIPVIDKTSEDYLLNTASVLYKLGSDPEQLNVIFSAKNNPEIDIKPNGFPNVYYKPYYGNILLGKTSTSFVFRNYYYSKLNTPESKPEWVPLFKSDDKIKDFVFTGTDFYFLSALNSPNYKLCKTNINKLDFRNPEVLVKEDAKSVITDFSITKDAVYYVKTKNGIEARLYTLKNGREQEVPIPRKSGFIDVSSKSPNSNDLWIEIYGWTNQQTRFRYNPERKSFVKEDLSPLPKYSELDDVIIEEIEIPSYDGVMVPLSIIYKKGTKLNGKSRVFMDGYGSIGYSLAPYPFGHLLHWIHEGGIYATAHVRGGGEKGDDWHKGGYKQTKPNTWKDFIACTEYLIKKGYTSTEKMAIWGGSGGGILIARAITERPDLYSAAVIDAGLINMLRSEFGANGKTLIKEFGTIKDSTEFQALYEMDACQHVKKGTKYPAILLLAGANDARVPMWHSAKFAAHLQAVNTSENPVLLSIDFGGGHTVGTSNQWDLTITDIISFALWQTGHPDFQLKE